MTESEALYVRDKLIKNLEIIEKKMSNDRKIFLLILVLIFLFDNSNDVSFSFIGVEITSLSQFLFLFPALVGYVFFQFATKEFYRRLTLKKYSEIAARFAGENSDKGDFLYYWPYNYRNVEDLIDTLSPDGKVPIRYGLIGHKIFELLGPLLLWMISVVSAFEKYGYWNEIVLIFSAIGATYICHSFSMTKRLSTINVDT